MSNFLRSNFASPAISALIWIVISLATGSTVVFALVGAIGCFVVVYAIQELYRRVVIARRR